MRFKERFTWKATTMAITNDGRYLSKSRDERIAHVDLDAPCVFGSRGGRGNGRDARRALARFLSLSLDDVSEAEACHLCESCSTADKLCENPRHLYFGTSSENKMDIKPGHKPSDHPNTRAATARMGKSWGAINARLPQTNEARIRNGKLPQTRAACERSLAKHNATFYRCACGKEGYGGGMTRWHMDNCRTSINASNEKGA